MYIVHLLFNIGIFCLTLANFSYAAVPGTTGQLLFTRVTVNAAWILCKIIHYNFLSVADLIVDGCNIWLLTWYFLWFKFYLFLTNIEIMPNNNNRNTLKGYGSYYYYYIPWFGIWHVSPFSHMYFINLVFFILLWFWFVDLNIGKK